MAVPDFNAYTQDESFNKDNKNIDTLYADYVQWLINKKNHRASVSELLLQMSIISAFLESKVKAFEQNEIAAINEPINSTFKHHKYFRVDPFFENTFAVIVFLAIFCGIISATLIGASFAPALSGGIAPLRFFGIVTGIEFVALLVPTSDFIQRVTGYSAETEIDINKACNKISDQIKSVTDTEVNPALKSVKVTLLTACTYNNGFSRDKSIHSDTAADNMFVDLSHLNCKLRQ